MVSVALDKKNLKKFVGAMLKQGKALGPVATENGTVLGELSAKSDIVLDYANFKLPPKREFFPQCEVITRFDGTKVSEEPVRGQASVIFGVRPCDGQALAYLDKVFSDAAYTDPYYQARRDSALVISLACSEPGEACFCMSTGCGPSATAGADIAAAGQAASLLFEPVTKKGEAFLKKNSALFRAPTAHELQNKKRQESESAKRISTVAVSGAPKALEKRNDSRFWEELAETCLSCGACTFLCPTCHCFDLYEEKRGSASARIRLHDACMFPSFTREASGHNPRARKGERMRQRVMHKFSYAPENFGAVFCVGCGRCVEHCPSNIDIRETIAKVNS